MKCKIQISNQHERKNASNLLSKIPLRPSNVLHFILPCKYCHLSLVCRLLRKSLFRECGIQFDVIVRNNSFDALTENLLNQ